MYAPERFLFWLFIQRFACKVFCVFIREKTSKDNKTLCFFDMPCGYFIIHTSVGFFIMNNSSVHIVFIIYLILILFSFETSVCVAGGVTLFFGCGGLGLLLLVLFLQCCPGVNVCSLWVLERWNFSWEMYKIYENMLHSYANQVHTDVRSLQVGCCKV